MKGFKICFLIALLCGLTLQAGAEIYTYIDENGVTVYTDRKPTSGSYKIKKVGCYGTCRKGIDWQSTPLNPAAYSTEIQAASEIFGVDAALIRAVMHAESWFQPEAVSHSGAQGLMQLMPATQNRFGVVNAFDPLDNITAGVAYLAWLLEEFDDDLERAVAAYNAGENAVRGHGGVPPYSETQEYVRRVNILYRRYRQSG